MLDAKALSQYLDFAVRAAETAGAITLEYFPGPDHLCPEITTKADGSPVTIADKQAEEKLRELIRREYPDHGILGEEFGRERPDSEFLWIIDPIDGTKSFVRGVPLYGVLIALEYRKECVIGVIHHPALGETVRAAKGLGCFWNDHRATVSSVDDPKKAMILCTNGASFHKKDPELLSALLDRVTLWRGWSDCYGYTLVATGRAEVMLDPAMAPWDCAALKPILEEAGGTFTNWEGEATIYGTDAMGTNGRMFGFLMDLMRRRRRVL
jgi:histidinol phosphatase-like enzyme (inositol monophosphatase family)